MSLQILTRIWQAKCNVRFFSSLNYTSSLVSYGPVHNFLFMNILLTSGEWEGDVLFVGKPNSYILEFMRWHCWRLAIIWVVSRFLANTHSFAQTRNCWELLTWGKQSVRPSFFPPNKGGCNLDAIFQRLHFCSLQIAGTHFWRVTPPRSWCYRLAHSSST